MGPGGGDAQCPQLHAKDAKGGLLFKQDAHAVYEQLLGMICCAQVEAIKAGLQSHMKMDERSTVVLIQNCQAVAAINVF